MSYGEFIMFNNSGDSVYLNSFQDPILDDAYPAGFDVKIPNMQMLVAQLELLIQLAFIDKNKLNY